MNTIKITDFLITSREKKKLYHYAEKYDQTLKKYVSDPDKCYYYYAATHYLFLHGTEIGKIKTEMPETIAENSKDNRKVDLLMKDTTEQNSRYYCVSPKDYHVRYYNTVFEAIIRAAEYINEHPEDFIDKKSINAKAAVEFLPASENNEFYPTPSKIAGKMMSKIKNPSQVKYILEPEAGKGDLIDAFYKRFKIDPNYARFEEKNVDAIEKDSNLRCLLKGKGVRVIADDFLTFNTEKIYNLIIMNPPFSQGAKHLIKAISLMEKHGGQILCLLNAQTIRNPYSYERKMLIQRLTELNAEIEFIPHAFKEAEHKTDVEIALINIVLPTPETFFKSDILEKLKAAKEETSGTTETFDANQLVSNNWIEQMIANFNFEVAAGKELIRQYIATTLYSSNKDIIQLSINGDKYCQTTNIKNYPEAINSLMKSLRTEYWTKLLNRPELTRKMTADMSDAYHSKIASMANYDFTYFNIMEVICDIQSQLVDGIKDSIMKLFEKLSAKHSWYPECEKNIHYYNGWRTNEAHKVGMKVILPINGFSASYWKGDEKKLRDYEICREISELERALNFLEKGEAEYERRNIESFVRNAVETNNNVIEFTYFTAKFYKKGTCHIKFRDSVKPVIDRLNIFAARERAWLPPCYGKKSYDSMTEEEKSVIDGFQGKEEYAKVMAEPEKYIISDSNLNCLPTAF